MITHGIVRAAARCVYETTHILRVYNTYQLSQLFDTITIINSLDNYIDHPILFIELEFIFTLLQTNQHDPANFTQ